MLSELLQETVNFYKKFAFEINVIRLEVSLSFFLIQIYLDYTVLDSIQLYPDYTMFAVP